MSSVSKSFTDNILFLMIPKLIHYSWFSGEPYPEHLKRCMDTWARVLPDYELMLWDADRLRAIGNTFADEAVSVRKWAFAADFVRLYAVYHYGGIWLDTDVEMFKSFDPFLGDGMFIGREYYVHNDRWGRDYTTLTSHCFGAEKEHPFLAECLEFYEHRHFIRSHNPRLPERLRYDLTIIPMLQMLLARNYGFDNANSNNRPQVLMNGIHVYPYQWFDQPGYTSMRDVVCIHRVAQSWNPDSPGNTQTATTDPKRKTLGYYKMRAQKRLSDWILSL